MREYNNRANEPFKYKGRTITYRTDMETPHYFVEGLKTSWLPYSYHRTLKEAKQAIRDDLTPEEYEKKGE